MTITVQDLTANSPMALTPATTVYTGTVQLGRPGVQFSVSSAPAEDFGFFVPDAPPLDQTEQLPGTWAEAYLMLPTMIDTRAPLGVVGVAATYIADPRGGPARWLHCGGMAYAPFVIRIGYRVTVQQHSAS